MKTEFRTDSRVIILVFLFLGIVGLLSDRGGSILKGISIFFVLIGLLMQGLIFWLMRSRKDGIWKKTWKWKKEEEDGVVN